MSANLEPEELNALMSAIQDGRVAQSARREAKPAQSYDLTSPDRIIRGQMPTLDAINEQVASALAIGLSGRTRLQLTAQPVPASMMKFVDLALQLAPPSVVAVLELGQGMGLGLAVLESRLAESLLAAALGDKKARPPELPTTGRRELTSVEQLVLRRLLAMLTDAMQVAWTPVVPLAPAVRSFEADPRMAMIAAPNDVAIVSGFEVGGPVQGRLQIVIPYAAVEPVKARLTSPRRPSGAGGQRFATELARELHSVPVEMRALLGTAQLTLQKLLELEAGDVLTLDTEEAGALPVLVQGRVKLHGRPEIAAGAMAVRVEHAFETETPDEKSAA